MLFILYLSVGKMDQKQIQNVDELDAVEYAFCFFKVI